MKSNQARIVSKTATVAVLLCLLGFSCQVRQPRPRTVSTAGGAPQPAPLAWTPLIKGIERRVLTQHLGDHPFELTVYRLDPSLVQATLSYQEASERLDLWQQKLRAHLVINGSYFTEAHEPTGYFKIGDQVYSEKMYDAQSSGTVAIKSGRISFLDTLKANTKKDAATSIFQSFPYLIKPDGSDGVDVDSEKVARRTILAQDKQKRILVILLDKTPLSLFQLMHILRESDLDVALALNLDGGPSSGLVYHDDSFEESIIPLLPLPIVLSFTALAPG